MALQHINKSIEIYKNLPDYKRAGYQKALEIREMTKNSM